MRALGWAVLILVGAMAVGASLSASDIPGRAQAAQALRASVVLAEQTFVDRAPSIICGGVQVGPRQVLTAYHCVAPERRRGAVKVQSYGRSDWLAAEIVQMRPGVDLALLQTEPLPGRVAAVAPDVMPGESIWVVGAPDGEAFMITRGIVSKVSRDRFQNCSAQDPTGTDMHQQVLADANVFFGNSGGGMFTDGGLLVGIVVRVATAAVGDCATPYAGEFILWGYAVGPATLREALNQWGL